MRVVVLSDIHANLHALQAVLEATAPFDGIWVLGDSVGYGPRPDEVIDRLASHGAAGVLGNHDAAAIGALATDDFNALAREALEWTSRTISPRTRDWLAALPERRVEEAFTMVHGSPRDPLWEYLLSMPAARLSFAAFDTRHCLVGHTHLPLVFRLDDGHLEVHAPSDGSRLELDERRCILNPGSVGQPRDGDPRASAMLIDTASGVIEWRRIAYAIEKTQDEMREAGLPRPLIARLGQGV